MIHVTHHALERFVERVAPCSLEEARERILEHARAIEKAAEFGCEVVRCGSGERLILDGTRVLTVYAAHNLPRQCRSAYRTGGLA
jgi:hypothetical protein